MEVSEPKSKLVRLDKSRGSSARLMMMCHLSTRSREMLPIIRWTMSSPGRSEDKFSLSKRLESFAFIA